MIKQLMSIKINKHEFNMMIVIRLVEGLLITLVREVSGSHTNIRDLKMRPQIKMFDRFTSSLYIELDSGDFARVRV